MNRFFLSLSKNSENTNSSIRDSLNRGNPIPMDYAHPLVQLSIYNRRNYLFLIWAIFPSNFKLLIWLYLFPVQELAEGEKMF